MDLGLDGFGLDADLRPGRREKLILGQQTPGIFDEISQHRECLGRQADSLVGFSVPVAPETLVV